MDRYDALGKRTERYSAFTEGLLAEAEDAELQAIANDAAGGLDRVIQTGPKLSLVWTG